MIQAFDQHLNMVIGEVEESVITREIDEETDEEIVKVYIYFYVYMYCIFAPNNYICITFY
jgi:small nuclear ribonucleoprotein (snRNP)-like protein